MKRGKKLLINVSIIMVILLGIYYFGGYYISKEQCITETLRALYAYEKDVIMEFEHNNRSYTLLADADQKTYSIVGTRKIGFLYHTDSSSTGFQIKEEHGIDVFGMYNNEIGTVIFVYRNDKSIAKVDAELENGDVIMLNEWKSDYVGFLLEDSEWLNGTYKAYDDSNQLIEEVCY